ncbi:MAG: hypothetical protein ACR2IS_14065, partial [Nitrososphaeraceae archaeon]
RVFNTFAKLHQYMSRCGSLSIYLLSMVDVVYTTPLYIDSPKGAHFSYLNTFAKTGSGCSPTTSNIPGLAKIIIDISLIFFQTR